MMKALFAAVWLMLAGGTAYAAPPKPDTSRSSTIYCRGQDNCRTTLYFMDGTSQEIRGPADALGKQIFWHTQSAAYAELAAKEKALDQRVQALKTSIESSGTQLMGVGILLTAATVLGLMFMWGWYRRLKHRTS